ncbi:ribosomal RNA small subunit methyltransferase C [Escherichia coli]|uniref:Ribosomal RNA small subunit methyltransferase C n=1 Tax=Escherichia coli TaxID=562 RepID=A0A376MRG0_ECOLX|nr:ribosomal RNA small subunit methyltransferase C [Escherichia coli]
MSAFTPASEVLLRHSDDFEQSRILFAGDLQDDLPARLDTAASRAHTQQFHHWQVLSRQMGDNARFSLVATADDVADCDTLIYYWPKNKPEAQFQFDEFTFSAAGGHGYFCRWRETAAACAAPNRCWQIMRR